MDTVLKKYFWILLIGIGCMISLPVKAQWVTKITLEQNTTKYQSREFRAIAFEMDPTPSAKASIRVAGRNYEIIPDEHSPISNGLLMSNLIVFDSAQTSFRIFEADQQQIRSAYLIHTPELNKNLKRENYTSDSCTHPDMIMQEEWRQGLPDPDYDRIPNAVSHQIIHHSATDNELTDYVNLVRSIYLYHTEVNGWSDMGYNYLISPDGVLFAGRDPGENLMQDNVLGAHFCASNSGTMGICLLGTFMTQVPNEAAINTLNKLISWKAIQSNLDPEGSSAHPLNQELGTIAGHRDGCSTACPGDALYAMLPQIREKSLEIIQDCGVFPGLSVNTSKEEMTIFPNPIYGNILHFKTHLSLKKAILFDIAGHQLASWQITSNQDALKLPQQIKNGLYFVHFFSQKGRVIPVKILVAEQY